MTRFKQLVVALLGSRPRRWAVALVMALALEALAFGTR